MLVAHRGIFTAPNMQELLQERFYVGNHWSCEFSAPDERVRDSFFSNDQEGAVTKVCTFLGSRGGRRIRE